MFPAAFIAAPTDREISPESSAEPVAKLMEPDTPPVSPLVILKLPELTSPPAELPIITFPLPTVEGPLANEISPPSREIDLPATKEMLPPTPSPLATAPPTI